MIKDSALYIHIPFCDHKCIYCDFYSIITSDNIEPFLQAVKQEITYYSGHYGHTRRFGSIFFGGGTPSLLTPSSIKSLIDALADNFTISGDCEITLETNPGTVELQKLKDFRNAGINRLSVGIQSFHDSDLSFLTRIHNKQTALNTIANAADAGFENINIDLIFNLPGQSADLWQANLETAVTLPVTHISAYSLILERGTILNKMVLDGKVSIQDEDHDAELYAGTINFLTSRGFEQYEVSNFAKPGYQCRHNNAYWQYHDYLGFGPSAHSFVNGKRWWNYSSLKRYINEVKQNRHASASEEIIDPLKKQEEYILLALRSSGIIKNEFRKNFGSKWLNEKNYYIEALAAEDYLTTDDEIIKLTGKGYAVCDEIIKQLI